MKIFCDTNILIEYLCKRTYADVIEDILSKDRKNTQLFISVGCFYTITFIIEKYLRQVAHLSPEERMAQLREILLGVLSDFNVVSHTSFMLKLGVEDVHYKDLEDSYQNQAAINSNCDVLLTINKKDFTEIGGIEVLTPLEFVAKY